MNFNECKERYSLARGKKIKGLNFFVLKFQLCLPPGYATINKNVGSKALGLNTRTRLCVSQISNFIFQCLLIERKAPHQQRGLQPFCKQEVVS